MNDTTTCQPKSDPVNHPSHYTQGGIECVDAIKSALMGYTDPVAAWFAGQVLKYIWRAPKKNGLEDLKKADWYLDHMTEYVEEQKQREMEALRRKALLDDINATQSSSSGVTGATAASRAAQSPYEEGLRKAVEAGVRFTPVKRPAPAATEETLRDYRGRDPKYQNMSLLDARFRYLHDLLDRFQQPINYQCTRRNRLARHCLSCPLYHGGEDEGEFVCRWWAEAHPETAIRLLEVALHVGDGDPA